MKTLHILEVELYGDTGILPGAAEFAAAYEAYRRGPTLTTFVFPDGDVLESALADLAAPLFTAPWPGKLLPGACLSLRGREVCLPTDPQAYRAAGIELRSPPDVWGFEALCVLLPDYRALLLATEVERRAHLPADLPAILHLDEWRHPDLADDELPSHTETFRQLAAVLCTGDPAHYAPTVPPNTHWRHWPHGGDGAFFGNATALEG